MNFAVGYQQQENGEPFATIIAEYRSKVGEVYFPWVGTASGRAALGGTRGSRDWTAQHILENDLAELSRIGIRLDLLLNANCYGERAISKSLENEVLSIIDHLDNIGCHPEIVTTASIFIARTLKKHYPGIEVRASVNMRIGTVQAMSYAEDLFDSFYLQRDLQRDIDYVAKIHDWCQLHSKKLCLLVNSGCLRFCPGQSFHDNLIAHSASVEEIQNVPGWNPHVCWNLYQNRKNFAEIMKSTWIRPEDLHHYEGLIDVVKLATRQHSHPRMVIGAYTDGCYRGNLLDLLEPGFSSAFLPNYIDNSAFPDGWIEQTSHCSHGCETCQYCADVLQKVLRSCQED